MVVARLNNDRVAWILPGKARRGITVLKLHLHKCRTFCTLRLAAGTVRPIEAFFYLANWKKQCGVLALPSRYLPINSLSGASLC